MRRVCQCDDVRGLDRRFSIRQLLQAVPPAIRSAFLLTAADLKCYIWVRWLKSGVIDHVAVDIVKSHAPLLSAHCERVTNHPRIAAYYAARSR